MNNPLRRRRKHLRGRAAFLARPNAKMHLPQWLARPVIGLGLAAFVLGAGLTGQYATPGPSVPLPAPALATAQTANPPALPASQPEALTAQAPARPEPVAAAPAAPPSASPGPAQNLAAPEQILGLGPTTLEDFPHRLITQELKDRPDFTFHALGNGQGPVMLVVGGIQGDEPGGFSAASLLVTHYNITKGSVWVVPNLNFLSILKRDRGPSGDMNRKFALLPKDDPEYDVVTKIKGIILKPEVEAVFNLHDGSGFYRPQWEGPLHNPARWGQSVIIDQEELSGHRLGRLKNLADYAVNRANTVLLEPEHRYHLKNTNTSAGDTEMEKTLT